MKTLPIFPGRFIIYQKVYTIIFKQPVQVIVLGRLYSNGGWVYNVLYGVSTLKRAENRLYAGLSECKAALELRS